MKWESLVAKILHHLLVGHRQRAIRIISSIRQEFGVQTVIQSGLQVGCVHRVVVRGSSVSAAVMLLHPSLASVKHAPPLHHPRAASCVRGH